MHQDGTPGGAPPIPKTEPGDLEDVSWALSTAEASWQRGDPRESLKWLRRAAEAATEGSANVRAVFLANAAADLASSLDRKSLPPTMAAPPAPPTSPSVVATARSGAPLSKPPLPPASQRPVPPSGSRPSSPPPSVPPRRPTPAPLSAAMHPSKMPIAAAPVAASTLASRGSEPRKGRRSSHALEAEAKGANASGPVAPGAAPAKAARPPRPSATSEARRRRPSRPPPPEPSEPHPSTEPGGEPAPTDTSSRTPSIADEIDAWPTQAMEGSALADLTSEMARAAPPPLPRTSPSFRPPPPERGGATQAVRVLVWRSPDGVRIAPLGSSVQAPTVEAMLVALDPSADLAAWLARR